MKKITLSLIAATTLIPTLTYADFVKDSQVSLTARNFYLDRNFTDPEVTQPAAKQWVQGLILNAKSGYTDGTVGFGADLYAGTGFNLWGEKEYLPAVGLTPAQDNGDPVDSFGEIGLTGKMKISETELKVGTLFPFNPVLVGSPARLLPQTYQGVSLESKDIDGFKIEAGYVNRVNHRDSTDWEKIRLSGGNMKYPSVVTDGLYYVGGYYYLNPETSFALYHANLDDVYDQYTFWVRNKHDFTDRYNLSTDFRYFNTSESGSELAGNVDSQHANLIFSLGVDQHKFSTGYIYNSGETGFPYLSGGEANTYMDAWATDFLNPKEKAWTLRYDYDFKNQIPGFKLMTRYTKGTDIELKNLKPGQKLEESIFGIELSYQLQSTFAKGLFVRLRHEDYKNDFGPKATFRSAKEQRVNIDYTWKF